MPRPTYETQLNLLNAIYQYSTDPVAYQRARSLRRHPNLIGWGAQINRLRDISMDTKQSFERAVAFTLDRIAEGSQEGDGKDNALGRSIAC